MVGTGAMLLDIGKTRLPTELLKKSGAPSDEEWRLIHAHVDYGIELLRTAPNVDSRIVQMIATHHERSNGSGYLTSSRAMKFRCSGVLPASSTVTMP